MKAPVGLLSDRTVLRQQDGGASPRQVRVYQGELGPALVSCALFQFMWSCNDFMGPLLYVQTPAKYPMSLFVKLSMDGDTGFAWNRILALSLISILPQLIVFFCAQDQFVEGISAGAVKG